MTYYWMGQSLFLTISAGDHTLVKEVLWKKPVEKNTKTQFQMITHLSMYPIPQLFSV